MKIAQLVDRIESLDLSENDSVWRRKELRKIESELTRLLVTGTLKERRNFSDGEMFDEGTIGEV